MNRTPPTSPRALTQTPTQTTSPTNTPEESLENNSDKEFPKLKYFSPFTFNINNPYAGRLALGDESPLKESSPLVDSPSTPKQPTSQKDGTNSNDSPPTTWDLTPQEILQQQNNFLVATETSSPIPFSLEELSMELFGGKLNLANLPDFPELIPSSLTPQDQANQVLPLQPAMPSNTK